MVRKRKANLHFGDLSLNANLLLLFYSYEYYPLASGFFIQKKGILTSALYSYSNNDSNESCLHFPVDKENAKEGTIPCH